MKTDSVTLKERLKQDISFNTVVGDKGEGAISFRGLNFKATEYVEDDISLGVSPIGGVVQITSTAPTKVFEGTLSTILSSNDE